MNIYDIENGTTLENVAESENIYVTNFSEDGSKIVFEDGYNPKLIKVLDVNTKEDQLVGHN